MRSSGRTPSGEEEEQVSLQIDVDAEGLAAFCQRAGIRRLSFFGSVLREDFGPESDIDVLVEFPPDSGIGLFEFVDLQRELAEIIGREVDLHTPASLSHFFREDVVESAEVAYAA
jgi:predicted nucleotidyltransferase